MSIYYKKDLCGKKKEKDHKLTLECGKIFNPDLPSIFDADPSNPIVKPIKLASVTIDTRSLRKQCVSIEYSSIIDLTAVGDSADGESITLNFRLIRECKNKKTKILQEWEYVESNLDDTNNERKSKETFTVTFCECLDYCSSDYCSSDSCTYTMELVKANPFVDGDGNPTVIYNITNKNILAISSCENHVQCGNSFDRSLPPILDESMPPVKLASVAVDTHALRNSCVNIKYSSIINLLAANVSGDPNVDIILRFRLIRECKNKSPKTLQEWEYIEPSIQDNDGEREYRGSFTVSFCECLDCFYEDCCIYTIELVKADPFIVDNNPGVLYNITNKNISAVISSEDQIQCGKEFNRSLPPRLNDDPNNPSVPPVKLASVNVDTKSLCNPYVNIEYSSIINAIAADVSGSPNVDISLRFRLIRECRNRETEVLQEWEYIESAHEDTPPEEKESKESFTVTFCDCLDCFGRDCCTYTIELIKAAPTLLTDNIIGMLYNITNKNISAIVTCKSD